MSKCKGCGITLQSEDALKEGYTPKKDGKLCQRCFKITNYNSHENIGKLINNAEIIKGINSKKCATMYLCDLLNLNSKVMEIYNAINNPKILVITKSDIIPKNIKLDLLEKKIKKVYGVNDLLFISSLSGYGKRNVLDYIDYYGKVLLAGPTSSGKSSLINFLFGTELTVSNHKNTTQEFISLKLEENEIIDAPGFNEDYLDDSLKQIGYINPKTLLLKKGYMLCLGNTELYADQDMNLTLFLPKNVNVITKKVRETFDKELNINSGSDLIINNLGFIYFKEECLLHIKTSGFLDVRESIVGGK